MLRRISLGSNLGTTFSPVPERTAKIVGSHQRPSIPAQLDCPHSPQKGMLPGIHSRPSWRGGLILLLLLLSLAEFIWRGPVRFLRMGSHWSDLSQLYFPSRAWSRGLNPYSPDNFVKLSIEAMGASRPRTDVLTRSAYPLTSIVLVSPIAVLPWPLAQLAWAALLSLSAWLMIWSLSSYCNLDVPKQYLYAGLVLALAPLQTGVGVGNVSIAAVALSAVAFQAGAARKERLAGMLLGIAVCLKPQVGFVLVLYYALRKRWKLLSAAALLGTAVLLLGSVRLGIHNTAWITEYLQNAQLFATQTPTVDFADGNLTRFSLINLQVPFYSLFENRLLSHLASLTLGGALVGCCLCVIRISHDRNSELLSVGALSLATLLPGYHRNYDATVLIFLLCWGVANFHHLGAMMRRAILVLMLPFAFPGPALLDQWRLAGRIPATMARAWWWNAIVMPHQIWALLFLSMLMLYALAAQRRSVREVPDFQRVVAASPRRLF